MDKEYCPNCENCYYDPSRHPEMSMVYQGGGEWENLWFCQNCDWQGARHELVFRYPSENLSQKSKP